MKIDPLLNSFQLRHLSLRNRIISTAHAPAYVEDGHPKDRYRLYHEEKAKGGVALTIIGGSTNIAPDSPSVFGQLYAGDDSIIPWFQRLTDGVKSHGAAVMCQITHMGRRTAWDDGQWLPVLGPSGTRERAHRSFPKAMELEDIDRVIDDFAAAAVRCQKGGFDGIEILSHSHLLGQFLSPTVNRRDDDYGGSLENRLRLTHRVLDAVRSAVGPDFIVGMRVTGDELTDTGLTAADCIAAATSLAATGRVDFLNVLAGAPYDDLGLAGWVPPMGMPSAPHLTIAGGIRQAVDVPVIHAGGIADLATARHAIIEGHVDLIGMTRAQIADPYLVAKLMDGQETRIRPCVGLGYCVDRVNQGKDALCGHNPATGREGHLSHKFTLADKSRRVVIVGGGPAGMEAARVCRERGHAVTLFEASGRLGGQILMAATGRTRRQTWGIADWLISEMAALQVDVHLNTPVDADDVLAEQPDVVIVATGGLPNDPTIQGADHTVSTWDVLTGQVRPTGDILMFDDSGDHAALVCADVMAQVGGVVHHVTPDRMTAQELGPTNSAVVLRDLAEQGVTFSTHQDLVAVEAKGNRKQVTLRHVLTGKTETHCVDHCVVELGTAPNDDLYFDLKARSSNQGQIKQASLTIPPLEPGVLPNSNGFALFRIGDAVAGRNIHAAILDAMRICVQI